MTWRVTGSSNIGTRAVSRHNPGDISCCDLGVVRDGMAELHGKVGDWLKACSECLSAAPFRGSVVIFEAQVRDQVLTAQVAQSVLELH
jgi:hypothetical protein